MKFVEVALGRARGSDGTEAWWSGRFALGLKFPSVAIEIGIDREDGVVYLLSGEVSRIEGSDRVLITDAGEKAYYLEVGRQAASAISGHSIVVT